jgi:hypothetical protein
MQELYRGNGMENKFYRIGTGLSNAFNDYFGVLEKLDKDYKNDVKKIMKQQLSFYTNKKKKYGDIARFSGIYKGFSKKFVELLEQSGVKNFQKYPIKVVRPTDCPTFYYLDIKCKKLKKMEVDDPVLPGTRFKSASFKLAEWGEEDLLSIENTLVIICTEKVKNLIEKNKLKNFKFDEVKPV